MNNKQNMQQSDIEQTKVVNDQQTVAKLTVREDVNIMFNVMHYVLEVMNYRLTC